MVEDQHVVGIVTDRYLTVRVAAKRMDPNDVRPQDVLTKAGQTVSPNAELSDARARMSERGSPVVKDTDRRSARRNTRSGLSN